jgi:lantibiotic biosynthesis protein
VREPRKWKRVLNGRLREHALEATYAIAENLPERRLKDASLCQGKAGLAIFYTYLAETRSGYSDEKRALQFLHQAADAVARQRMSPGFFGGFTGVAWVMEHLEGRLLESDGEDPNQAIDEALKVHLTLSPWRGDYDLITGLVGIGVYTLARLPRQTACDCLESVIDRLDETAERTTPGITWFTAPELLSPYLRKLCPKGHYNVGLAHGVPGVITLLGQVCATADKRLRAARAKARPLLDGAVAWLLAQQPQDRTQSFPYWIGPAVPLTPSRLAWCYGDLGIAAALLRAARCVKEPAWEREALMIARRAAERSANKSDVKDCGLCHGAAGVAHLFNRLFQATDEPWLGAAARFWFERTLEMRRPNRGVAGFAAFRRRGKKRWIAAPGILEGAAGIGLALLAATTPIEPKWDRMLMLSGSPR